MNENKNVRGIDTKRIRRIFVSVLLIAGILLVISFLFNNTGSISLVYFLFGILAIFSASIYIQIHLFYPKRKKARLKKYPSLAVLMPSYNTEKTVKRSLESVLNLNYPRRFDVYFIDDGSTDNSARIAEEVYKRNKKNIDEKVRFKLIKNAKNIGKAASLNSGIKITNADVVACIDADTYPRKDVLIKMVPYLYNKDKGDKKDDVIAVTGFIVVANSKNLIQRMQELEYYGAFGFAPKMMVNINGIMVIPGPMSVLKRKNVINIGGFDEKNITEDMEIGLRMHRKKYFIEYCPDAIIPTEVPDTLYKLYRQRIRWYRGTVFNLNKYKDMMLNPNYKDFGIFAYPSCLFYVVFTLLTFFILTYHLAKDILFKLQIFGHGFMLYSLDYLKYFEFGSTPIMFNSSFVVFFFVFLGLWFYYMLYSIRQARVKLGLKHISGILAVIIIYPMLISSFYTIAFFKEILGSKSQW